MSFFSGNEYIIREGPGPGLVPGPVPPPPDAYDIRNETPTYQRTIGI